MVAPTRANCARFRSELMQKGHAGSYSGHHGTAKTLDGLRRHFWWPGMAKEVEAHCKACASCQRNKPSNAHPSGLLYPLPVPSRKWSDISMDFIGPLPMTRSGHDAVLVVVDRLSKMTHFAPTTTTVDGVELHVPRSGYC